MVSMDLNTFEYIGKTENKARLFFKKYCWKNSHIICTRCNSYKVYRIINKRYRCKRCRYTFHDFSNRWLNRVKIPYKKWLWIIKLFELEISARKISQQVKLSYPTVHKAVNLIRLAIIASDKDAQEPLHGEIELDVKHILEADARVSEVEAPGIRFLYLEYPRETG